MSLSDTAERLKAEAEHFLAEVARGADTVQKSVAVEAIEAATLGPKVEQALADFIGVIDAELNPVDPASLPNVHFFGGPAGEPVSDPDAPVTVADQRAAGVAPEDTVTVADQRAGVPVAEAAAGTEIDEPADHTTSAALP